MATTGTRKQIDVRGHQVDLVFFWFDSSRSVENPEVDGVASRRKTDAGEVRRGQDIGATDGQLHYHSYVADGNSRADYGWMVSIDGVQRTGVFAREEDALEMATELIGDIEGVI